MQLNYLEKDLMKFSLDALNGRGVNIEDIAEITYELQKDYHEDLTLEKCEHSILAVLSKREAAYAILTGIEIDKAAERGSLSEPLLSLVREDYKLYGIDEILPLSIMNIYGTIGLTNFGYLDKMKPGIISKLDNSKDGSVNTFLDDLVAAIAAAAASRIAHTSETSIALTEFNNKE